MGSCLESHGSTRGAVGGSIYSHRPSGSVVRPQLIVIHNTSNVAGPPRTDQIPEDIRAIGPRNTEEQEPCLRFFAGSMCYGGSKTKCASSKRTHTWPDPLPPALMDFIKKKFGRRGTGQRRHA
ncbi:hypothetical protein PHMEG_00012621 [Phytophthora megakarya]|uniref:Uncharacterized protein n=1 Tax=Phytophthora megakarya TaxID=4795 RepID=A0A225W999_9STRA|nr:hypothetical protein PHMEG_00012621 [Phytophthora megakarya]